MKRAFLLGIDGLAYSLVTRLIDQGIMPNLKLLSRRGSLNQIHSTLPDAGCSAWTSFATGVNPGKHGIFGYLDFHAKDGSIYLPSALDSIAPPLWHTVGNAGGRSIVLNLPGTYPVQPLKGKIASGYITSDFSQAFYPFDFSATLNSLGYRYEFDDQAGIPDAESVRRLLGPVFAARKNAIRHIIVNEAWDLAIAVVTETDRLQHYFLGALDDATSPDQAIVRQFYAALDAFIGEVAAMLEGKADLFLVSDHGFALVKHTLWLDEVLRFHGLTPPSPVQCWKSSETALKSRVFSLDPGRFYINKKNGRFPHGRVSEKETPGLLEELKSIFSGFRDPDDDGPIIEIIKTKDEAFWGPATDFAPDLVISPRAGYHLQSFRNKEAESSIRLNWEANHTWNDALVYLPYPITQETQPMIWDVLPTVLTCMGVTLPEGLDGRNIANTQQENTEKISLAAAENNVSGNPNYSDLLKHAFILKQCASTEEITVLKDWAISAFSSGALIKNQSDFRNFNRYSNLPKCDIFELIRSRIADKLGLGSLLSDPVLGDFLSFILPGGQVPPHQVTRHQNCQQIRANLICLKPGSGGKTFLDGIGYDLDAGDALIFFPDKSMHWSDIIQGQDPRIICSFGWSAPGTDTKN